MIDAEQLFYGHRGTWPSSGPHNHHSGEGAAGEQWSSSLDDSIQALYRDAFTRYCYHQGTDKYTDWGQTVQFKFISVLIELTEVSWTWQSV